MLWKDKDICLKFKIRQLGALDFSLIADLQGSISNEILVNHTRRFLRRPRQNRCSQTTKKSISRPRNHHQDGNVQMVFATL